MQGLQLRMGAVYVAVAVLLAVVFFSPASCHLQEVQHTKAGAARENVAGNTNEEKKQRRQQKLENNDEQEETESGNRRGGMPSKAKGKLVMMEEGRSQMITANGFPRPSSSLVSHELELPPGDNNDPMHTMGDLSSLSMIPPAFIATIPTAYSETPIVAPASAGDVSAAFDSLFSTFSPTVPATTNPLHAAVAAIGAAAVAPLALDPVVLAPFAHGSSVLVLPSFSLDEDAATSTTPANATADGVGASLPSVVGPLRVSRPGGYSTQMERVLERMAAATAPTPSHEQERLPTTGGGDGGEPADASAAANNLRVPVAEQIRAAAKLGDLSPSSTADDRKEEETFLLESIKGGGSSTIAQAFRDVVTWISNIIPDFGFSQEEHEITRAERKLLRRLGHDKYSSTKEQ